MKHFLVLLALYLASSASHADRVRRVKMKKDHIVQVKTALGVATIIQVADSPTSLVVGDNEAFKVEFLEQAITIKPLYRNAKSNLYIYTEYRRFDVQLVTVEERSADYVVYLENVVTHSKLKPLVDWKNTKLELKNNDLRLRVIRLGRADLSVFLEFEVSGKSKIEFDPSHLWITQKKSVVTIHRLVLSSLKLSGGQSIKGVIEILKGDLDLSKPFTLELRRKATTKLEISKVVGW